MSKQTPNSVKKYSIKDVDDLIKSIHSKNPTITEEAIAQALGYAKGYISQQRSREEALKKPQVSPKFMDKLQQNVPRLQNASQGAIEISLMEIAKSLDRLETGQTMIRAEVRAFGQYPIQQSVNWDQEKFLAAMAKVGMLVGAALKAGDLTDNNGEVRS